jgi:hypothetical protein
MSSKIYPEESQIQVSRQRIRELEFIISDIYKQRGCVNWCLSMDKTIIADFRTEIRIEQQKINDIMNSIPDTEDIIDEKVKFHTYQVE